jgi:hypothetical protein
LPHALLNAVGDQTDAAGQKFYTARIFRDNLREDSFSIASYRRINIRTNHIVDGVHIPTTTDDIEHGQRDRF